MMGTAGRAQSVAPGWVWARAGVVGAVALLTGVVSHIAASGLLPGVVVLASLLVLSVVVSAQFLRSPASRRRLVLLVVGGQAAVHAALSVGAGHRGDHAGSGTGAILTRAADEPCLRVDTIFAQRRSLDTGATLDGPLVPTQWLTDQVDHVTELGPVMLAAHLAGAVVLGLFLAVGEAALWRAVARAGARVRAAAGRVSLALARVAGLRGVGWRAAALAPTATPWSAVVIRLDRPRPCRRGPPTAAFV